MKLVYLPFLSVVATIFMLSQISATNASLEKRVIKHKHHKVASTAKVTYMAPSVPKSYVPVGNTVDASQDYTFTMHLKGAKMKELEAKMTAIAAEGKGRWLTEGQLKEYAAPHANVTRAIKKLLKSNGISEGQMQFSKLGDSVQVKTTVETASKIFEAEFKTYHVAKKEYVTRTTSYKIPSHLAAHVLDVSPLTHFSIFKPFSTHVAPDNIQLSSELKKQNEILTGLVKAPMGKTSGQWKTAPKSCDLTAVSPQCLKDYYHVNYVPKAKPAGSTPEVGVMGFIDQYVSQSDLKAFNAQFAPAAKDYSIPLLLHNGAKNNESDAGMEAMLDVETVVAGIYPLPSIFLAEGDSNYPGDIFALAFQDLVDNFDVHTRPKVITASYGANEIELTQQQGDSMCQYAQKLSALGTTILVSSGDNGVIGAVEESCPEFNPNYPSGCPYVTSVGGTQGFVPETMVDSKLAGFSSGAGASNLFKIPSFQKTQVANYQKEIGTERGYYNTKGRMYPDISAQGSIYDVILGNRLVKVSGTSASAPFLSTIMALINDKRASSGLGSIGWANPGLYKAKLHDITEGGSLDCIFDNGFSFPARKGWDSSSGNGTPMFKHMSKAFGV